MTQSYFFFSTWQTDKKHLALAVKYWIIYFNFCFVRIKIIIFFILNTTNFL